MSFYNVRPRYTPGSPGMVDRATAEGVARAESRAYQAALEGVYGFLEQFIAQTLGVARIVVHMNEWGQSWDCHDLMTQERYRTPFAIKKGERVEIWSEDKGWVAGTVAVRKRSDEMHAKVRTSGCCPDPCRIKDSWEHEHVIEIRREFIRLTSSIKKEEVLDAS